MATEFDAIIIGTGQAGPSLAGRLNAEGLKTAVIERKLIGGTCVNVGCIPTKTLVASARAAHVARRGPDFGVMIDGPVRVDMKKVKARMKGISGESNQSLAGWLEGMENVILYRGHGRFEGPNTVSVDGEILEAERIFINVGGRAYAPAWPGLDEVPYLDNASVMEVDFLPEHLIVVGGGYIGLEFAQMYRRFGSEVTVIQRGPRLIPRDDEDVSDTIREILEKEGIQVRLDADCFTARKEGDRIIVGVDCEEGSPEVSGSHLLLAVGRTPNTHDLGLDQAGVRTDDRGFVEVDDALQTSVSGVWALGDCNGRGAFTHTSYNDYEIVAANLFDDDTRRVSDRILCYGLFIDPPLGRVGMTEREARESGRNVMVGYREMASIGRARERSETDGFMKVLVDGDTQEIIGAAILGVNGDEAVHTLLPAMYAKAPYTVISRAVHIHPTIAELLPTVLQGLRPLK